jgi:extracellular elastinolytic metalloproteinase
MRARRDRSRPTKLDLTHLEDRSVPSGSSITQLLTPPAFDPDGHDHGGLNLMPRTSVLGGTDFLTGPQPGAPRAIAEQTLATYATSLGLSVEDALSPFLSSSSTNSKTGVYHAYFKQTYNGLPVLNTSAGVHVMPDGRVLTVSATFVPGLAATATGTAPTPGITAAQAVSAAAGYFGITLTTPPVLESVGTDPARTSVVSEPEASIRAVTAELAYVNTPAGVRAGWHFDLDVPGGGHWFDVAVDAETGQVTFWSDWVEHYSATYNVLPSSTPDPVTGPRQVLVNPFDPVASPFGWHDTNGFGGADFADTRGNNVFAQADLTGTDNSSIRPSGGSLLVFNNPLNLAADPVSSTDASVTQLFYINNILHDVHFRYGFDEAAGNFQQTNFTGQGVGGDPVQADALDEAGNPPFFTNRNNANFATPPDGFRPRMQMYVWTASNPNRDSTFDTGIPVHEYGHGVSTRLTGGPADSNALNNTQSGGMGEGWSDYWALMFNMKEGDSKTAGYPAGTYADNSTGIRRFPYSFDMAIDPLTWDAYGTSGTTSYGVARTTEVHDVGEIWCSALFDMTWLLIDKYGFDKDLSTGYAPGNGPASAGNKLSMQLVMDALKLQPANPSFLEARNAILAADLALTGGQNRREIWTAFARRGLGTTAITSGSNDTLVLTSFAVPSAMTDPAVVGQSPAAKTVGGPAPSSVTLTFSEPIDPATFTVADVLSFTGPGGVVITPNSVTPVGGSGNTQFRVNFTALTGDAAQGDYQLVIGADIAAADTGSPLDQDIDGVTGEAGQDGFVANFRYDAQALTVLMTSIAQAAPNQGLPAAVVVVYNQAVDLATLDTNDVQVSQGTVQSFTILPGPGPQTVVRYDLAGVTSAPLYVSVKYGAVSDPFGFPVEAANARFGKATLTGTPIPTPLNPYGPLGWGSFEGTVNGSIAAFGQVQAYQIDLDAGTNLTVALDRPAGLRATVQVFDPDGNQLATATAPTASDSVFLGPFAVPVAGTYTFRVAGVSNSTGGFRLRALVGAAGEGELVNPAQSNNITPQNLDGLLVPVGGPGSTATAVNVAGNVGQAAAGGGFGGDTTDTYSLSVVNGRQVSIGLARPAGGAALTLTVTGPGAGAGATPTNFDRVFTFVPTATGTVNISVSSGAFSTTGTDYVLHVLSNGSLDSEGNNSAGAANPAVLTGNVQGGLTGNDADFYTFSVAGAPTTVYLTTLTPGDGPNQPDNLLDPELEIFDAGGNSVAGGAATDNAAGDGRNSALSATLPVGTYRFRVRPSPLNAGGTTTGEYVVNVTTAANPGPLGPKAGGPYTVAEGQPLTLTGTATDPNGDGLTYTWDLNGDGFFGDVTSFAPTVVVPWATLVALGLNDGPTAVPVQVRVSDGVNPPVTSPSVNLTVANGPPTAAMYVGAAGTATALTVDEGATGVVVRLAGATDPAAPPTDPGPLDAAVGLRYAFDLDGNGLFDDAGGGDGTYGNGLAFPSVTVPASTFADGPGAKTILGRVIDKDGAAADFSVAFTVTNLAPAVTGMTARPVVGGVPGAAGAFEEGRVGRVTAVGGTDPSPADAAALRYAFDLDNDGQFDDGAGDGTYAGSIAGGFYDIPAGLLPEGPATITIGVVAVDKDGAQSPVVAQTFDILNAAPVGTPAVPASADEGADVVVGIGGVTDPSAGDAAAGFRYAFDFDNNGTFEVGSGLYATSSAFAQATVGAAFLPDGTTAAPTTLAVRVRVIDRNDGFTDYVVPMTVTNVAPAASLSGPPAVDVGSPLTVSLINQIDPSPVDQAAGFTYSFDFNNDGDFTDPGDVLNSASATAGFTFQTFGTKTVRARVTDKDGGATVVTADFLVENVQPGGTIAATPSVVEGGVGTVSVTATHPSAVTTATGFRYAYDFDGDGVFDLPAGVTGYDTASPLATVAIPARFTNDGARPLAVRVRVFEKNGPTATPQLSTDLVTQVQVTNAPPTATLTGPAGTIEVGAPVTFVLTGVTDPSPADAAAGFTYSFDFNNDGDFTDPGEVSGSAAATATTTFTNTLVPRVRARVTDKDGGSTDVFVPVTVRVRAKVGYATGVDAGNAPAVQLYDRDGNPGLRVLAFDPGMTAGVRVASADFTGDGIPDVVAATGPGVLPEFRVLDGTTGRVIFSSRPFEGESFTGGLYVAAGDMDGDGRPEIAVSPDEGGGPRVILYRGLGFIQVVSFLGIDDTSFRGGARVGMADLNGDGRADLLVSAGFGGGPRVAGFDGAQLVLGVQKKLFNDFFAFEPGLRNGVFLTGGDVNGDGTADVVVGAGPGGAPRVTVYDGVKLMQNQLSPIANFFTGNNDSRGGVRVAVTDIDGDTRADVVTGEADGPRVNLFFGRDLAALGRVVDDLELTPFSTPMNGVFVG